MTASYLSGAWLCGLLISVIMRMRAMITPVLITSENIIMTMMSHIKVTSPLWYNSDLTRPSTIYKLRHGATAWKKHRKASCLFEEKKYFRTNSFQDLYKQLVNFLWSNYKEPRGPQFRQHQHLVQLHQTKRRRPQMSVGFTFCPQSVQNGLRYISLEI